VKGRILPLADIAEYGKTDSVILTLSINSTEAGILLDALSDYISGRLDSPTAVRYMIGVLETIRDRAGAEYRQDMVNTEARLTRYVTTEPTDSDRSALRGYLAE
jgi:hypothetical protein